MKFWYFITLLLVFITSCISTKINYLDDKDNGYCHDIVMINNLVLSDNEMLVFFELKNKELNKIYLDTLLHFGLNELLFLDLAKLRLSNDPTKESNQVYSELRNEQTVYNQNRKDVILNCFTNKLSKKEADLEVKYSFDPVDLVYFIEINLILKKPGYSRGYLYMIGKKNQSFMIIKKTFWTE